jgi:hypothetical protein
MMARIVMNEREKRIRAKNRALLAVLLGVVLMFYLIALARMGSW